MAVAVTGQGVDQRWSVGWGGVTHCAVGKAGGASAESERGAMRRSMRRGGTADARAWSIDGA